MLGACVVHRASSHRAALKSLLLLLLLLPSRGAAVTPAIAVTPRTLCVMDRYALCHVYIYR